MTVARFFAGVHPLSGELGVWMSKNGIDVRSTLNPANFLLMPSRKFEQIVKAGEIYIPANTPGTSVYYDTSFTKSPYIFFMSSTSASVIYHPHSPDISLPAYSNHAHRTLMIYLSIWGDRIHFQNVSDTYGLYVSYFVLHRSITG